MINTIISNCQGNNGNMIGSTYGSSLTYNTITFIKTESGKIILSGIVRNKNIVDIKINLNNFRVFCESMGVESDKERFSIAINSVLDDVKACNLRQSFKCICDSFNGLVFDSERVLV